MRKIDSPRDAESRLAYKIHDAPAVTGASRTRLYAAIRNNELTARKAGRATLLLADELQRWLKALPAIGRRPEATS
jgi:excisionase family DNA binding protein